MKVTVTQEHIDNGVPGSHIFCMVALALREALILDYSRSISVVPGYIYIYKGPEQLVNQSWVNKLNLIQLINNVDSGGEVQPFTIELDDEPQEQGKRWAQVVRD